MFNEAESCIHFVQTQEGKKARGLVKSEFQAAMKWLFVPLVMKDVNKRAKEGAATFGGENMYDIIREWQKQLNSCFALLKKGKWESQHLNETRKPAMKARQEADAAQAIAQQAKTTCLDRKFEYVARCNSFKAAQNQWHTDLHNTRLFDIAKAALQHARSAEETMVTAHDQWCQAQKAADKAMQRCKELESAYEKQLEAYKPSKVPFFWMMDNCPSYSPFADKEKTDALAICPFLQVLVPMVHMCNCSQRLM